MAHNSKHKDKLEQNRGILMQMSIMASLLIVLLLFESKSKSAEVIPYNFAEINLAIENTTIKKIEPPLPNYKINSEKSAGIIYKEAQFKGGEGALRDYVAKELNYPSEAKNKDIIGRVIVGFTINEDGKIKDAKVIRSIHPLLDTEALKLIKGMPEWEPATHNGKAISSTQTLPVIFINK